MKVPVIQLNQDLQSGKSVTLIDVRTPVEFDEMRIPGSLLMPLDRLDPETVKSAAGVSGPCVLVCHGGKRAEQAFQTLSAAGCENLLVLDGGVTAWNDAGLPVERSEKKRLPLMRQVQLIIGLLAVTSSILALVVDKNFALIPAVLGAGLTLAGSTGWCGMAVVLSKMPWNKVECGCGNSTSCSV